MLIRDAMGGLSAMLVAFPAAIAFGIIVFFPLGSSYVAIGTLAGILGTICLGFIAPLIGGTPRLVSAPCAPAAAVLVVVATDLLKTSHTPEFVLVCLALVGVLAGVLQCIFSLLGGGRLIKFIPYPVVAGYLSAVGFIIILGQLNTFVGLPKEVSFLESIPSFAHWKVPALAVGIVSLAIMFVIPKITSKIPAPIAALLGGVAIYFTLSSFYPLLQNLSDNPFIIGSLDEITQTPFSKIWTARWEHLTDLSFQTVWMLMIHIFTLAVLLSVDTLKSCVILDALTRSRHNANRELMGQGIANFVSSVAGGMPGAGTLGASLTNVYGGGQTRISGLWVGVFSLLAYLFLTSFLAWLPLAALSGILIGVGLRMVDLNTLSLLKQKATWLDFGVVVAVVIVALKVNLIMAAVVGVLLAVLLFLRDQIRGSVIRRKSFGNFRFSKKKRLPKEMSVLEKYGHEIVIFELQGTLFFGTTDQLFTEVEPYLKTSRFIILDMVRVQSVDFTAAHMLKQINTMAEERGVTLCYCNLKGHLYSGQTLEAYLKYLGVIGATRNIRYFDDMNEAQEWAEEALLKEKLKKPPLANDIPLELQEFELFEHLPSPLLADLKHLVIHKTYDAKQFIFKEGERGDELYLLRRGEVKISLPLESGRTHHLATFSKGDFFGEMSFLSTQPRSASAFTLRPTEVFILSRKSFDKLSSLYPLLSGHVFSQISLILATRLRHADTEIRELEAT